MADNIWSGSVLDGNWDTGGNWSQGTKPDSTDTIIHPSTSGNAVTTGVSGEAAVDVPLWLIERGFTPNIATVGDPATIAAQRMEHRGSGSVYWTPGTNGSDDCLVDAENKNLALHIIAGTTTRLTAKKGRTLITGAATVSRIDCSFRDNPLEDATVDAQGSVTLPLVYQNGGKFLSLTAITAYHQRGGRFTSLGTIAVATFVLHLGEAFFNAANGATPICTEANLFGGVLDLTQSPGSKLITTLIMLPGSKLIYNSKIHTFTNPIKNYGGIIVDVN